MGLLKALILFTSLSVTLPLYGSDNLFVDDDFGVGNDNFSLDDFAFDDEFIEFDMGDGPAASGIAPVRDFDGDWLGEEPDLTEENRWAPIEFSQDNDSLINFGDNNDLIFEAEPASPSPAASQRPQATPPQRAIPGSVSRSPRQAQPAQSQPALENPVPLTTEMPASNFEAFETFTPTEDTQSVSQVPAYDPESSPYAPMPMPDRPRHYAPVIEPNEFGGAAAIPDSRRVMAVGEAPEEYLVRPGDTLFDICDQLIDEADYWPKLWALNPEIKNPHFIYPGMRLRFFPGDDEIPPYLQVVSEEDIIPLDMYGLEGRGLLAEEMTDLLFEDFTLATTEVGYAEEVNLPGSFNDLVDVGGFYNPRAVSVMMPGFIYSERERGLAVSLGGVSGLALVGPSEDVVFLAEETLQPGSTYTVIRDSGRIDNPRTRRFFGYRYEFVAHVRITRDLGDFYYQATPTLTRLGVQNGDILVRYRSTQRNVSVAGGALSGGEGVVIGFDYPGQVLGGEGSMVFISERYAPGTVIPIFQMLNERALGSARSKLPEADEQVGVVRIIEADDSFSLGYVIKNTKGIRVGDLIGRG